MRVFQEKAFMVKSDLLADDSQLHIRFAEKVSHILPSIAFYYTNFCRFKAFQGNIYTRKIHQLDKRENIERRRIAQVCTYQRRLRAPLPHDHGRAGHARLAGFDGIGYGEPRGVSNRCRAALWLPQPMLI